MYVVDAHLCANHTPVLTFRKVLKEQQHTEQMESTRKNWEQFAAGKAGRPNLGRPAYQFCNLWQRPTDLWHMQHNGHNATGHLQNGGGSGRPA